MSEAIGTVLHSLTRLRADRVVRVPDLEGFTHPHLIAEDPPVPAS